MLAERLLRRCAAKLFIACGRAIPRMIFPFAIEAPGSSVAYQCQLSFVHADPTWRRPAGSVSSRPSYESNVPAALIDEGLEVGARPTYLPLLKYRRGYESVRSHVGCCHALVDAAGNARPIAGPRTTSWQRYNRGGLPGRTTTTIALRCILNTGLRKLTMPLSTCITTSLDHDHCR